MAPGDIWRADNYQMHDLPRYQPYKPDKSGELKVYINTYKGSPRSSLTLWEKLKVCGQIVHVLFGR